ncbi:hypothetical protein EVAR_99650_1 [Eumeta japonica]|uniref:Uncharacterized protein n=1 Tax=Eumeta variegata TaxID=151549 RepID=A0A4C1ZM38_EUMVA|nr:hypothetical protein EVAR_99650_1 [Eumeta japonica]
MDQSKLSLCAQSCKDSGTRHSGAHLTRLPGVSHYRSRTNVRSQRSSSMAGSPPFRRPLSDVGSAPTYVSPHRDLYPEFFTSTKIIMYVEHPANLCPVICTSRKEPAMLIKLSEADTAVWRQFAVAMPMAMASGTRHHRFRVSKANSRRRFAVTTRGAVDAAPNSLENSRRRSLLGQPWILCLTMGVRLIQRDIRVVGIVNNFRMKAQGTPKKIHGERHAADVHVEVTGKSLDDSFDGRLMTFEHACPKSDAEALIFAAPLSAIAFLSQ